MSRNWSSKKGSGKDVNHSFEKEGEELEGYYVSTLEGVGSKKNSSIHTVKTESGEEKNFWGCHVLDDQFSKVDFGAYVMVKYNGKKKTKSGNQTYYDFELFVDEGAEPASTPAPEKQEAATTATAGGFDEEDDDLPF